MLNYAPMPEAGAGRSLRDQLVALGFDPLQLVAFLRRRLELLLAVTILVFAVIVLYTIQLTPRFTASADVQIKTRSNAIVDVQQAISGLPADSSAVDTEVRILTSRRLAEKVVRELNLGADPVFNGNLYEPRGLLDKLTLKKPRLAPKRPLRESDIDAAVDAVQGGIHVQRSGLTYIIGISYTSTDRDKAALVANAYAKAYIVDQLDAKEEQARMVSDWLGSRLSSLRQEVEQADAQVEQYKIANNLMSAQGSTLAEQEVSQLNQQLATARAERAEKLARLQTARAQIERGGGGADVGAVLSSGTISGLRSQEAATSRELAELNERYGPLHPDYAKAQGRLRDIQTQIQQELRRIISNLEAEVQVASQRVASLEGSQGYARGSLVSNTRAQVGLLELQRKAEASRAIYETFLTRSKETSTQEGIQQPDARIVSPAREGTKSYPNMKLAILFGAAIALMSGLAAIVAAELLDTGISTGVDVEQRFGLPHAASLPKLRQREEGRRKNEPPQDFLVDNPFSVFAEAFRNLRASLLLAAEGGKPIQTIAICSALPHEGKTTTAFCMMRTMAMAGSTTVLIDADLRRRGVSRVVDEPEVGLAEVMNDLSLLDKALVHDKRTGGMVLPVVGDTATLEDMFSSPKMDALLAALAKRFDHILIDTPPVLALAEARLVAAKVDRVVFLVQWKRTPAKAAETAITTLVKSGARVAGVCLTQVDLRRQSNEGYGDSYYYYRAYKNYYTQ
jgi:capsular exopolysaccharide synthesis family protein